jgi:hypothetical protein
MIGTFDGMPQTSQQGLEVTVKQAFDQPPSLVATRGSRSRVIIYSAAARYTDAIGSSSRAERRLHRGVRRG